MSPKLLPIEVAHLQHAKLGKEWVSMVQAMPTSHQPSKPLLVSQQCIPQAHISAALEVTPHHQAVLKVRENQPIVQCQKGPPTKDRGGPPQNSLYLTELP